MEITKLLPHQTWVNLATSNKGNLLTLGCGEGKYNVYGKAPDKESRAASSQNPQTPRPPFLMGAAAHECRNGTLVGILLQATYHAKA